MTRRPAELRQHSRRRRASPPLWHDCVRVGIGFDRQLVRTTRWEAALFSASIERKQGGIFAENFAPFMHMEVERQGQTVFMGKDSGLYFRVAYKLTSQDQLETTYRPPGGGVVDKVYVRCNR